MHPGEAVSDWWTALEHVREGTLGFEHDSFSAVAFTAHLWDALGPALVVAAAGLVVAIARRGKADLVLLSFVVAYSLSLLPLGSHPDRYVLPLVPVLGVLAGRFTQLAPVTLLLLVVPFTWTVRDTRELTKPDTRASAVARVEREAGQAPLVVDPGLPAAGAGVVRLELPQRWSHDPRRDVGAPAARRLRVGERRRRRPRARRPRRLPERERVLRRARS